MKLWRWCSRVDIKLEASQNGHVIYMVNSTSPLSKLRHTRYGTYTYVAGELGVLVLGIDTPDNPN